MPEPRQRPKMRGECLLACVLILFLASCSEPPGEASPTGESSTEAVPAAASTKVTASEIRLDPDAVAGMEIAVEPVKLESAADELTAEGYVTLNENRTAKAGSFTNGIVVEARVFQGAAVKKGQILARIHSHEVHGVKSEYRRALAELERRRAELEYAQQAHARASRLFEIKAGSLQHVQEAETALQSAESGLEMAEANVEEAKSHLRYLGLDPSELQPGGETEDDPTNSPSQRHLIDVRSPLTGTVVTRHVTEGAVVSSGEVLYTVSDLSNLWVIARVPEGHLGSLREGAPVHVFARAYPDRPFSGRITWIADFFDRDTRTVQVRCEVPNPQRMLKTEMYVTLRIPTGSSEPVLLIPNLAVQDAAGQSIVFVRSGPDRFQVRAVETGRMFDERTEIVRGLEAGEQVVVKGGFLLKSELLKSQMMEEEE